MRGVYLFLVFISIYSSCVLGCYSYLDNSTMLVLGQNALWIESTPKSPYIPTYLDYQGLRISLKSNGQAQLSEIDNGNVLWTGGFSNQVCNATMNCKMIFQPNGNLVIYYDSKPTGQPWYTDTANKGTAVLFRTSPPYLQIVNSSCQAVWTAGTANRTTPVRGPTYNVTVTDKAIPANRWKAMFAVNTHISHGWPSSMVANMTAYLGVGAIRDSQVPKVSQLPDFIKMKNAGTTLDLLITGVPNQAALAAKVQNISSFVSANAGIITSIEGFNEINGFGFVYNGVTDVKNDLSGMFQAQRDLYSLVKANAVLKKLPVYDFTGGCFYNGGSLGCKNFTGRADYGNVHNYPSLGEQPVRNFNVRNQLTSSVLGTYPETKAVSSMVVTEFGYHSSNFTPKGLGEGVTYTAQSILIVNYYLAGLKLGFRQLFQYELFDEAWSGYDGAESHFGLFYNNRTAKPVARALHFLSEQLSDTSGKSGTLKYSFTNLPNGADYLLLQKSNSRFVLIVWNKAPVYNYVSDIDVNIPTVQVQFKLPSVTATTAFKVFDIYNETADDTKPLVPLSSSSVKGNVGITFPLGAKAVVLTVN